MKISISQIKVTTLRREVDDSKVEEIAESIKIIGLLNPITLSNEYELIAGLHRLWACESLGMTEIEANVVDLSELDQEIAQIDENLMRNELTMMERAESFKRRKEIYELQHPTTKQGGDRKSEDAKSNRNNFGSMPSFAQDTASKLKVSERTIQQDIQIAENLTPEAKKVVIDLDIPKTEALKAARLRPEEQIAHLVAADEEKSKKKARKTAKPPEVVSKKETSAPAAKAEPEKQTQVIEDNKGPEPEPVDQTPDKSTESTKDTVIKQLDLLNDAEIIAVIEAGNKLLAKRKAELPDDYAPVSEDFLTQEQERTPPVPAPLASNVSETSQTSTAQEQTSDLNATAQESTTHETPSDVNNSIEQKQEQTTPVPAPFVSNVLGETTTQEQTSDMNASPAQEPGQTTPVPAPSTSASKPAKTPCEELQSEIYNNITKLYLQQAAKTDKTAAIELANFTFESKTPQATLEECLGLKFKTFENLFEIEQVYSEKFKQLA